MKNLKETVSKIIRKSSFRLLTFLLLFGNLATAQTEELKVIDFPQDEYETYLRYAPRSVSSAAQLSIARTVGPNLDTISLPFFDDFSVSLIVPDQELWCDKNVFVNRTQTSNPVTIGVASFDGLDGNGQAYDLSLASTYGSADSLTSQAIDLSSYNAADLLFLSFYYETGGLMEKPDRGDSLALYFLKSDTTWASVWSTDGADRTNGFEQSIVQVLQPNFFHSGFQFRFVNYGSLAGMLDIWNLDYVRLDKGRSPNDTSSIDVAYKRIPESILNRYHQMPWDQFLVDTVSNLNDTLRVTLTNLDDAQRQPNYFMNAVDLSDNSSIIATNAGNRAINPFSDDDQTTYRSFNFNFRKDTSKYSLSVDYSIAGQLDDHRMNDTASMTQYFDNYFAHDDGSAESAIGLNVSGGQIAYKFILNKPDTLRAVQFFFAQIKENTVGLDFDLIIWKSIDEPGNSESDSILYSQNVVINYTDSLNKYINVKLDTLVGVTDSFYVGWQQNNTRLINLGLDKNRDSRQYRFKKTQGFWENSTIIGSWMMRPMLSDSLIPGLYVKSKLKQLDAKVFPNPFNDKIRIITMAQQGQLNLTISDLNGKVVLRKQLSMLDEVNLEVFAPGMYLLSISNEKDGSVYRKKLIKQP